MKLELLMGKMNNSFKQLMNLSEKCLEKFKRKILKILKRSIDMEKWKKKISSISMKKMKET